MRTDFGPPVASLEPIGRDEFFPVFDSRALRFPCQDEGESRFSKFVWGWP